MTRYTAARAPKESPHEPRLSRPLPLRVYPRPGERASAAALAQGRAVAADWLATHGAAVRGGACRHLAADSVTQMLSFIVYGRPQPQGSTRAFLPKGTTRPVITSDNKRLKPWRQEIAGMAKSLLPSTGGLLRTSAVRVQADFFFKKPKSARKSTKHKTTKPDVDKLVRGVLDGLTGIAFDDDSQVTEILAAKFFGLPERAEIRVSEVPA